MLNTILGGAVRLATDVRAVPVSVSPAGNAGFKDGLHGYKKGYVEESLYYCH